MWSNLNAVLVLEDGKVFSCSSIGFDQEITGEVVFNTSMSGYLEIVTDPSYRGQMVILTYPMIGNYGVNIEDAQSNQPHIKALIVKEMSRYPSNFRSQQSFLDYLIQNQIVVVENLDTRSLVRHIRQKGAMRGIISKKVDQIEYLKELTLQSMSMLGADLVKEVTTKKDYDFSTDGQFKVAAIDFGIKKSILDQLKNRGCSIRVYSAYAKAENILKDDPDGIFLSNGPGDPSAVHYGIDLVKKLIGHKPIFGICLGHQILSLALGGETYKLKFGHRGGNQPVKEKNNPQIDITSQNHGFAVKEKTGLIDIEITHLNLNDKTVEGIRHKTLPIFSVQHHPEASPGPHDARHIFDNFIQLMKSFKESHANA